MQKSYSSLPHWPLGCVAGFAWAMSLHRAGFPLGYCTPAHKNNSKTTTIRRIPNLNKDWTLPKPLPSHIYLRAGLVFFPHVIIYVQGLLSLQLIRCQEVGFLLFVRFSIRRQKEEEVAGRGPWGSAKAGGWHAGNPQRDLNLLLLTESILLI